jgi:hypothetical protein
MACLGLVMCQGTEVLEPTSTAAADPAARATLLEVAGGLAPATAC